MRVYISVYGIVIIGEGLVSGILGSPFEFEDWVESELIWKSFSFIIGLGFIFSCRV